MQFYILFFYMEFDTCKRHFYPEQKVMSYNVGTMSEERLNFMHLIVDADACPRGAMDIMRRLQKEYGYRLITVASFNHNIEGTEHIVVGDGPDEADLAIANRTRPGDIVVTQDWGLAALVLGKGAHCLSPTGRVYKAERIEFQLDERHVKAKFRRGGGRTKGPKARTAVDDERFEKAVRRLLQER